MKANLLFALACLVNLGAAGQSQAETFIEEAQGLLAEGQYRQAQLSLQDAINDINLLIAAQVADSIPDEINGLISDEPDDINTGMMGMLGGGLQITKTYHNPTAEENEAEVQLMANSPMLSAMNMYLSNPAMLGPEYKSVRVGTQRAILKTEMQDYDDGSGTSRSIRSSEIQIPLSETLITINLKGFATEQAELAFAAGLNIAKIKEALGE